jgi:hypothetical protein
LRFTALRAELANPSAAATLAGVDATLLAFRDEETLAANIRQNPAVHHLAVKTPKQTIK